MLTKGAIGNLVNRYKAVLKKCNLINTFGSLAVASMLVLGGAGVASAEQAEGVEKKYDNITTLGIKIVGGWEHSNSAPTGSTDIAETNITINNVNITDGQKNGHVYGGNYVKYINPSETYKLGTSTVTIDNSTIEMVVGGHGAYNSNVNFDTESTNLIINSGTFGSTNHESNCVELVVVGGNMIRTNQEGSVKNTVGYSENGSANITIKGGTFNAAIIGGSAATVNHNGQGHAKSVTVKDTYTFTKITGGTFSHPIVAGGMAYGPLAESQVGSAKLEISGPVNLSGYADIYAGGIRGGWNGPETTTQCVVANSVVTINDASVKSIYGTNAKMDLTGDAKPFVWVYKPLKDNADDFVTTELTLTNVNTADDGEVFIPVGTVTLKSANATKMSIAKLTVQAKDKLTVAGDGATNDAIGGDAAKLKNYISVAGNTENNVNEADGTPFTLFEDKTTVALDEGTIVGAVTGTVENGVAHTTEKPNETNVAMADLPLINHMLTRVEMNDLRKRMGDIRLLEGETGTWARWEGGRLKGDNGLTNDFHKIQLGADTTTGIESLRLGASFSYTNGDMDFAKASAESDTLSFAGYGVWTADNGMFADVIARLAFIDTEIQTDKVKGELDNLAFSLSGEYGWRFDLCDQFFVEPQVELTYTYIDSDDFTSAGAKFDFDSSDSLIGRAGLAAGWKLPDDRGDLYARASVVQEFMGDGKLTASMGNTVRRYETDGDDTWFEYGIGANIKLNKNVYVFGDVERTEGAEIDEEWRGTVGLRYSF